MAERDEPERRKAERLQELAKTATQAGDLEAAAEALAGAHALWERILAAAPQDVAARRALGVCLERQGDLALTAGRIADAADAFRRRRDLAAALSAATEASAPEAADLQRDLAVAEDRLGDLANRTGDPAEAERRYAAALAIREKLVAAQPGAAPVARELAASLQNRGDAAQAAGRAQEAQTLHQRARDALARLHGADPQEPEIKRDLAVAEGRIGQHAYAKRDFDEAGRRFDRVHRLLSELAEAYPHDPRAQSDLATSWTQLGDLAAQSGDLATAESRYAEALPIYRRLAAAREGDLAVKRDLSVALARMGLAKGRAAIAAGKPIGAARAFFQESLSVARKIAKAAPKDPRAQEDLTISLGQAAIAAFNDRDVEAARTHGHEAFTRRRIQSDAYKGDRARLIKTAEAAEAIGERELLAHEFALAIPWWEKARAMREQISAEQPDDPAARCFLARAIERQGAATIRSGDVDGGTTLFREAAAIFSELKAKHGLPPQDEQTLQLLSAMIAKTDAARPKG